MRSGVFRHEDGNRKTDDTSKDQANGASGEEDGGDVCTVPVKDPGVKSDYNQTCGQDHDTTDHPGNVKPSPKITTKTERVALISTESLICLAHLGAIGLGLS